jgi:hypothetical protein
MIHRVEITEANKELVELRRRWGRPIFSEDGGIGPLDSLHQAGDAIASIAGYFDDKLISIGSGIMIAPGVALTATHVLDEFPRSGSGPVFLTFLPDGTGRAWLPTATVTVCRASEFPMDQRKVISDLTIVSCTLNSSAHATHPLSLAPMEICLPVAGERLWAVGFRHGEIDGVESAVSPLVSSGLVTASYPQGRGERMPSPCVEVAMEALGGMSGGPVFNEDGRLIGIVSSSFDGGPSYVTLVWDSLRVSIDGLPKDVWGSETSGLVEGVHLGLARVKGDFKMDEERNVALTLSDEEMQVLVSTMPDTKNA